MMKRFALGIGIAALWHALPAAATSSPPPQIQPMAAPIEIGWRPWGGAK